MKSAGFTLIELAVVIMIVGILATLAIPSYQSQAARSQVVESLGIVEELKTAVAEYYKRMGKYPVSDGYGYGNKPRPARAVDMTQAGH